MAWAAAIAAIGQAWHTRETARKTGRKARDVIRSETKEGIRRAKMAQEREYGQSVANIGTSGVEMASRATGEGYTGTAALYLEELQDEQKREIAWMKKSGRSRGRYAYRQGQIIGDQATYQGGSTAVQNISNWYQNKNRQSYSNTETQRSSGAYTNG